MSDYSTGHKKWQNDENESVQAKQKYRFLKRKLRCLLYEQECFQEELRRLQRKLLRVNRDKSFLLDRLLQYEPPEFSSSDEEETASSSEEGHHLRSYWSTQDGNQYPEQQFVKRLSNVYPDFSTQGPKAHFKSKKNAENVEKVRCKQIQHGKRCPKMVSRRVKSGMCLAHREVKAAKASSRQRSSVIQPRSSIDFFSQPNPMISGISNDHLTASASSTITDEMYSIPDMTQNSNTADSPTSSDFHSNIYEGDDDLVIDLPE